MQPTAEQQQAIEHFANGDDLAIEARAGAGKTSTMRLLGESTDRKGVYVAFNRAIVDEAKAKMPANVTANTMHSIAYRVKGAPMRHRLNSARIPSSRIAQILGLQQINVPVDGSVKVLQPAYLASLVMRAIANYCNSADTEPNRRHVPYVKGIDPEGGFDNNNAVADAIAPFLGRAWADLQRENGQLRYSHDCYLKAFELDNPKLDGDFILYDEAQDASPVMSSIVFQQTDAQLIVVGDSCQAIYAWRGAIDSLADFKERSGAVAALSQSFRFGPAVADVANLCLSKLGADPLVAGTPTIASEIGTVADADVDAILTRTNAAGVRTLFGLQREGRKATLMGGGGDMLAFAKAARDLMQGRPTYHPELACFDTWGAVQDFCDVDPSGDELRLAVNLVDEFTAEAIINGLERLPKPGPGVVTVSTAHKAKGCEWGNVRLADDFNKKPNKDGETPDLSDEELRLLYVAVTRAQLRLDVDACDPITDMTEAAALTAATA